MLLADYINKQLGKPWEPSAEGDKSFDCYGLVRYTYLILKNIDLPAFVYNCFDNTDLIKTINQKKEWACFSEKSKKNRKDFDIVLMGKNKKPTHVGIYLNDGVLHCARDAGVTWAKIDRLKTQNYNHLHFYEYCLSIVH